MNDVSRDVRIKALAERSSYVENVLCHALVAGLSSLLWQRDPERSLQVFNSEVDDAGFDIILACENQLRYVQLKQAHAEKTPSHVSVRAPFALLPGACVVLMSHGLNDLSLSSFRFYGGTTPIEPMPDIASFVVSKSPGRRAPDGTRKIRENYRNVRVSQFQGPLNWQQLFDMLFPAL
ncbi:hypothetical protein [Thermomonas carbonis]|uniref:Uncharacterized protein n=1 Tax=Thermomonas carbonis TaxID=1463158 RepID=A0A7G9SLP8_9GAMM|nr:hypothetical protein [Thermomonas carbonis]QNN68773.1 hypothetical protein H9L16_08420 [Thermomonas carbonis]GHC08885.1 hypothetical protein GCM10010080_24930 [Thermomonas carbonis]